jgi:hypothetical protein
MKTSKEIVIALCTAALAGCGGSPSPSSGPGEVPMQEVGRTEVAQEQHQFVASGVQDQKAAPVIYVNSAAATVSVQVVLTATRSVQTPTTLAGSLDSVAWVSVVDETRQQVLGPDTAAQIRAQAPGSATSLQENVIAIFTVQPGSRVAFTPTFRVFVLDGSTGAVSLTTTKLVMRVGTVL